MRMNLKEFICFIATLGLLFFMAYMSIGELGYGAEHPEDIPMQDGSVLVPQENYIYYMNLIKERGEKVKEVYETDYTWRNL